MLLTLGFPRAEGPNCFWAKKSVPRNAARPRQARGLRFPRKTAVATAEPGGTTVKYPRERRNPQTFSEPRLKSSIPLNRIKISQIWAKNVRADFARIGGESARLRKERFQFPNER
jgi:hypothetical protein